MGYSSSSELTSLNLDFLRTLSTSASSTCFTHAESATPESSAISLYEFNCSSVTRMCGSLALAGLLALGRPLCLSATANPIMSLLYHIKWWYIKCLLNEFMVVQLIRSIKTPTSLSTRNHNRITGDSIMTRFNTTTPQSKAESEKFDTKHKSNSEHPEIPPMTDAQRVSFMAYLVGYRREVSV